MATNKPAITPLQGFHHFTYIMSIALCLIMQAAESEDAAEEEANPSSEDDDDLSDPSDALKDLGIDALDLTKMGSPDGAAADAAGDADGISADDVGGASEGDVGTVSADLPEVVVDEAQATATGDAAAGGCSQEAVSISGPVFADLNGTWISRVFSTGWHTGEEVSVTHRHRFTCKLCISLAEWLWSNLSSSRASIEDLPHLTSHPAACSLLPTTNKRS